MHNCETVNWLSIGVSAALVGRWARLICGLLVRRGGLGGEQQQYKCELCGRLFKNLQALNGHMRLHGGYLSKKVSDRFSVTTTFIRCSTCGVYCSFLNNYRNELAFGSLTRSDLFGGNKW